MYSKRDFPFHANYKSDYQCVGALRSLSSKICSIIRPLFAKPTFSELFGYNKAISMSAMFTIRIREMLFSGACLFRWKNGCRMGQFEHENHVCRTKDTNRLRTDLYGTSLEGPLRAVSSVLILRRATLQDSAQSDPHSLSKFDVMAALRFAYQLHTVRMIIQCMTRSHGFCDRKNGAHRSCSLKGFQMGRASEKMRLSHSLRSVFMRITQFISAPPQIET